MGLGRAIIVRRGFIRHGNGIALTKPAPEVNISTALGTEGMEFLDRRAFADYARSGLAEVNRFGHVKFLEQA
jgi:hypothetical protein